MFIWNKWTLHTYTYTNICVLNLFTQYQHVWHTWFFLSVVTASSPSYSAASVLGPSNDYVNALQHNTTHWKHTARRWRLMRQMRIPVRCNTRRAAFAFGAYLDKRPYQHTVTHCNMRLWHFSKLLTSPNGPGQPRRNHWNPTRCFPHSRWRRRRW